MEKKLVFGSFNRKKSAEVNALLTPAGIEVVCAADFSGTDQADEFGNTLDANAVLKARHYFRQTGLPCVADDTGLETDALGGRPGVYSARFAGPDAGDAQNVERLLEELKHTDPAPRTARFRTALALIISEELPIFLFQGELEGTIATRPAGSNGFGYDPVFIPVGSDQTLAQWTPDAKNAVSHRGKAFRKLLEFIPTIRQVWK